MFRNLCRAYLVKSNGPLNKWERFGSEYYHQQYTHIHTHTHTMAMRFIMPSLRSMFRRTLQAINDETAWHSVRFLQNEHLNGCGREYSKKGVFNHDCKFKKKKSMCQNSPFSLWAFLWTLTRFIYLSKHRYVINKWYILEHCAPCYSVLLEPFNIYLLCLHRCVFRFIGLCMPEDVLSAIMWTDQLQGN